MADMFDRLRSAEERFEQLNELLMDPAVVTDQNRYRDLMREHKQLTPIVEKYREHMAARQERDEAKAMLAVITAKAPMAIRYSKVAINRGMDVDLRAGLELEKDLAAITFGTEDKQEGMDAFLAKRPAEFHNK